MQCMIDVGRRNVLIVIIHWDQNVDRQIQTKCDKKFLSRCSTELSQMPEKMKKLLKLYSRLPTRE